MFLDKLVMIYQLFSSDGSGRLFLVIGSCPKLAIALPENHTSIQQYPFFQLWLDWQNNFFFPKQPFAN